MTLRSSSLVTGWLLILLISMAACEDEAGQRTLETLHQLAADTPLYPGFQQLRSSDYVNVGHATVVRCYSARVNYADVRSFYSQVLEKKGWMQTEERQLGGFHPEGSARLTFRKGQYAIVLQHDNLDDPFQKCNYSLAYYFNPP